MVVEAVEAETAFAQDMLSEGVPGFSVAETRQYLEFVADQRLNFFERTAAAHQPGVEGTVSFDEEL
jgi:ribonucleoside-diphosphate reductase beta chain